MFNSFHVPGFLGERNITPQHIIVLNGVEPFYFCIGLGMGLGEHTWVYKSKLAHFVSGTLCQNVWIRCLLILFS